LEAKQAQPTNDQQEIIMAATIRTWFDADAQPETDASQELFACQYTTRELAGHLRASISSQPHGRADGDRMWGEFLDGLAAEKEGRLVAGPFWYRGLICRALAALGTDIRVIRFRKS
jgi:hypothetical protein